MFLSIKWKNVSWTFNRKINRGLQLKPMNRNSTFTFFRFWYKISETWFRIILFSVQTYRNLQPQSNLSPRFKINPNSRAHLIRALDVMLSQKKNDKSRLFPAWLFFSLPAKKGALAYIQNQLRELPRLLTIRRARSAVIGCAGNAPRERGLWVARARI